MSQDLTVVPGFMSSMTAMQQGASTAITSAFSVVTPAALSSFSSAVGPIGVANMIPAFYEATGNNVTSGMLTAVNHGMLGVSTEVAQSGYTKLDDAPGAGGGRGEGGRPGGQPGTEYRGEQGQQTDHDAPSVDV